MPESESNNFSGRIIIFTAIYDAVRFALPSTRKESTNKAASKRCEKMTALALSRTPVLFISGEPRRRFAAHFSRRSQKIAALRRTSIPRHLAGLSNGRKPRRRDRGGGVWTEEELNGSYDLEAEIYEFMQRSANPLDFPSRDDLIAAGRGDLARAIEKEGGWLAYGWESDAEEEEGTVSKVTDLAGERPCEDYSRVFQNRMTSVNGEAKACLKTDSENSSGASTSGRPMSTAVPQDSGIEGILCRLEKERSLAFGFVSSKEKEVMVKKEESQSMQKLQSMRAVRHGFGNVVGSIESTRICDSSNLGEGLHLYSSVQNSHHGSLMNTNNNSKPGSWRAWSIQRSGDPLSNFEAAEIVFEEDRRESNLKFASRHLIEMEKKNVSGGQLAPGTSSGNNCPYDNDQGSLKSEISVNLQHLELQLTSALQLLQFRSNGIHSYEDQDQESLLMRLHNLSDALEFQQNEIKNARDILRSTRAKLAVMEGKIAIEVIESQKVIEEKQKRLAAAEWSLRNLSSVCIIWPNSASEVLLAGSFDGWTSQWRMEKNNSGLFSVCLKLYPGRYEIKFIVDGVWAIDPIRPISDNNGFKNNLLFVS
ncbi:uncharacterized protein LOC110030725 [Phalaenopsis equestris]|uniref:uncharacterized protein LOC110030725 n=1 Tax=Phalaenopsis equestris TaxID=78828 RepID=UPI0009E60161|nr:uncharacterized protein LOC110030725 [Phalaenopsis equestris]